MNPLEKTVTWLTRWTGFPSRRLATGAELLLCVGALAEAQAEAEQGRFLIERKNGAQEAALRAHAMRRSRVHYKCDNSAKV
jgi:hypothetical protein